MRLLIAVLFPLAVMAALAGPMPAQTETRPGPTWGFDAELSSRYLWRGVTRRNAFVAQPAAYGSLSFWIVQATAGGWTNVELARAAVEQPNDVGYGRHFGEFNLWSELALRTDEPELAAGVVRYLFTDPEQAELLGAAVADRLELYTRFTVFPGPFVIGARTFWKLWDDAGRGGAYYELRAAWEAPLMPAGLTLLRAGVLGAYQRRSPDHSRGKGFSHVEAFLETQLSGNVGGLPLYALPFIKVQRGIDEASRRVGRAPAATERSVKWWLGMSLSYHSR